MILMLFNLQEAICCVCNDVGIQFKMSVVIVFFKDQGTSIF